MEFQETTIKPYDVVITVDSSFKGNGQPATEYIRAQLPSEVQLNVESSWSSPFADLGGGLAGSLLALGGVSLRHRGASVQVWDGSTPIEMTVPLELVAEFDATVEILDVARKLMRLAAPSTLDGSGRFDPPGPALGDLIGFVAEYAEKTGVLTRDEVKRGLGALGGSEWISVQLGKFLLIQPVVLINVSPVFKTILDKEGRPMRARIDITFRTFQTPDKAEIDRMFNSPRSSTRVTRINDG